MGLRFCGDGKLEFSGPFSSKKTDAAGGARVLMPLAGKAGLDGLGEGLWTWFCAAGAARRDFMPPAGIFEARRSGAGYRAGAGCALR